MNLKGKVAVVTGATGGIGRVLIKELDKEGVRFVLVSKYEDELKSLLKTLKGKDNTYFACDFSKQEEVLELSGKIKSKFDSIDILINLAGIGVYKPIEDITLDDWNNSLNIGLTGPFILTKGIIELLKKQKDSLVLNMGSGAGVIPMAGRSAYCSMKFGLRGLTLSLAEEFKRTNIRFVLLTLGSVLTGFGPKTIDEKKNEGKAYLTPEWVAERISEIIKEDGKAVEYTFFPSDYKEEWEAVK